MMVVAENEDQVEKFRIYFYSNAFFPQARETLTWSAWNTEISQQVFRSFLKKQ